MADPCLTPRPFGEEIEEISVNVEATLDHLVSVMYPSSWGPSIKTRDETSYTIHRVPAGMRSEADYFKYFVPKYFSIGPIYWGIDNELSGWREFNIWKIIIPLLTVNNREFLRKIMEESGSFMVTEARHCYDHHIFSENKIDNEILMQIMIFDGLVTIHKFLEHGLNGTPDVQRTRRDLLLLENQIPFSVLQCLFDSFGKHGNTYYSEDLKVMALEYVVWPRAADSCGPIPDRVHHLLHLFHSSLLPPPSPNSQKKSSRIGPPWALEPRRRVVVLQRRAFQSATQLLEAGVKFRKTKNKDAERSSMIDVRFRRGYIEIPRLSLQSFAASELLNLLAFEKFHPECGNHVNIYMAFMNGLVDTAKDVDLLVNCGVLENKLGSDEDVAHFFNTACDDKGVLMKFEEGGHYLTGLFNELEKYCATPRHQYRAKLERDYLSSPWSVISLVAGTVLLILTVVQTYMAVYSYFIPPKSGG